MTQDRAREHFSAFHEGTLEPGLRASLERRLAADPDLKAELNAYVETVALLDEMRHEPISAPRYLDDRIAARLEGARDLAPARPFWAGWFDVRPAAPRLAWGMGVAVLILASAVGLREMHADGTSQQASLVSLGGNEGVVWSAQNGGLVARFDGGPARRVSVASEGGDVRSYALAKDQRFEVSLSNPNPSAQRFKIAVDDAPVATVALPGSRRAPRKPGSGTATEFASALADAYGMPVVVKDMAFGATIRWGFESPDGRTAADAALHEEAHAILTDGNVLKIGP